LWGVCMCAFLAAQRTAARESPLQKLYRIGPSQAAARV
jgi:hypothetical protein